VVDEGTYILDLSKMKQTIEGLKLKGPHWRIMVDECAQLRFNSFFEKKEGG
jgi:hypothetical protein